MKSLILPPNVHFDERWTEGGIGRFGLNVLPLIRGEGKSLGGRLSPSAPQGALEMAARFAPVARPDGVLYTPGFVPPMGWAHRSVVTVHDLMYLDPAITTPLRMRYFGQVLMPQLRRCRTILTVSDHSASEVRKTLGSKGPEVVNVGVGVDAKLLDAAEDLLSDMPRLLFIGGAKKNKNLVKSLEAVALASRSTEFAFVVAGEVPESIVHCAPPNTHFVGHVPEEDLGALYAQSSALLMPSLDEGFGLPALEAMVAGTPVIYGARGALPDVVGQLGWPVDPTDVEEISSTIVVALDQPIEISRATRVDLVASHRWQDVAARVHNAVVAVL